MKNKANKNIFIFIIIIYFSLFNKSYSQNTINGFVKDSLNNYIVSANIQIINTNNNKVVAFGITDEDGKFAINVNENIFYSIKTTFIGYDPNLKTIELKANSKEIIEIILKENKSFLKEVIAKANSSGLKQKGDTLTYLVDKFMNGTEETLKDIVKKLPGMDINSNGKITSNGKEIDKLLIDGENFFENQHQLATENLNAKMIKNIELIKNYKQFDKLDNGVKSGITALNVNIKEEFKNKITGNIETSLGYDDKFNLHSNLFSFRKKLKSALILGSNNTGEQQITMTDYLSLTETENNNEISSGVEFNNPDDFPKFLLSDNNVQSRKTDFIGFNSVYNLNKKLKINMFSIFNNSTQTEEQAVIQNFFSAINPYTNIENKSIFEKGIFSSTKLETIYKPNSQTIFNYTLNYNYLNNKQTSNILNTSTINENLFNEDNKSNSNSIYNRIEYSKAFQNKNILKMSANYNVDNIDSSKEISGSMPFLNLVFNNNLFEAQQTRNIKNYNFGYLVNYNFKVNPIKIKLTSGLTIDNSSFYNLVQNQNQFFNNTDIETNDNFVGIELNYSSKHIFSYNLGLSNHYINKKNNYNQNFSNNFLFPSAKIKAIISTNNNIQFTYSFSNQFPKIESLLQNQTINDYRNINQNSNVLYNSTLPFHQSNLTYFYSNYPSFTFILNGNYSVREKFINYNNNFNEQFNTNIYALFNNEKIATGMYFLEKYFSKKHLTLYNNFTYTNTKRPVSSENKIADLEIKSAMFDIKIVSSYKKFPVNFEVGFKLTNDTYLNNSNSSFFKSNEFINSINSKLSKNIFASFTSIITNQKTDVFSRNVFILNPKIRYAKEKSKWEFNIYGNNILNINNTENVQNNSINNYFEQKIVKILSGYIMFETKFKI